MTKPFLKSAGGKTQLLPQLRALVPRKYGHYWEPFLGGGALFFDIRPEFATLCDMNYPLTQAYLGVRDDVHGVCRRLALCKNNKEFFLRKRAAMPKMRNGTDPSHAEWAAWVIYLNKTCFNGLWRVNKKGEFNVPFAGNKNPMVHLDRDTLEVASMVLQKAQIYYGDFALIKPERGDFVYFDPPYAPLTATSDFTSYTKEKFGVSDQVRLRDFMLALKKRGVHVLLSNSSGPLIRGLYAGDQFKITEVNARRSINSAGDKRGNVKELLIQ